VVEAARRHLDPARFALTALGPVAGGPLDERDWPVEVVASGGGAGAAGRGAGAP
jgi:hypothetical protein